MATKSDFIVRTGITVSANATVNNHVVLSNTSGIYVNGTFGDDGQVLTSNGSSVYWANSTSAAYTVLTSNTNLDTFTKILVDTSNGSVYLTLPSSPNAGDNVVIADGGGDKYTTPAVILRNGETINDTEDDLQLDIPDTKIEVVYTGSTWKVFA